MTLRSILLTADESEIGAGPLADLANRVRGALVAYSPVYTHGAYAQSGTDNVVIIVKKTTATVAGSEDWGFRITVDDATVSLEKWGEINLKVHAAIAGLIHEDYTYAASYVAGTPTYEFIATIT